MTSLVNLLSQTAGNPLENLRRVDQRWLQLRCNAVPPPKVIYPLTESLGEVSFDVAIAGGTLGIFLGAALQRQGWRVVLLEQGKLQGRTQEWNISRQELQVFLDLELLTESELATAIATEYNPAHLSFYQGYELWVRDILNIGVDPVYLLETLKQKFLEAGGILLEKTAFQRAEIGDSGVKLQVGEQTLNCRLLIDAMGHFSPIVQQVRQGAKPDGICLVVGSCAQGFEHNQTGDLIATITPILHQCQYFWEAFPARDGRTTYLFTYLDAQCDRFSLEFLMTEYLRLLPTYQNCELTQLQFQRFLFGFFPAYRQSPLQMPWSRLLAIGDSAGGQSPISFGGFGAMVRHLQRLTQGISEALSSDQLEQSNLALLQPYQPNIAVTWLFQKTMSVGLNQKVNPQQINDLMSAVFKVMDQQGDPVLRPFLQDVIQFSALTKTLPLVNPLKVLPILAQIGLYPLLDWLQHYGNLAAYSGLYPLARSLEPLTQSLSSEQKYRYHRWRDAWQYGAGQDYHQETIPDDRL
jgi:lycopene cyclase CruP